MSQKNLHNPFINSYFAAQSKYIGIYGQNREDTRDQREELFSMDFSHVVPRRKAKAHGRTWDSPMSYHQWDSDFLCFVLFYHQKHIVLFLFLVIFSCFLKKNLFIPAFYVKFADTNRLRYRLKPFFWYLLSLDPNKT